MKHVFWLMLLLAFPSVVEGTQLTYTSPTDQELGLPADLSLVVRPKLALDIPGRRIPTLSTLSNLSAMNLADYAVPLPQANTRAHLDFQQHRFGRVVSEQGSVQFFNPETVLVVSERSKPASRERMKSSHF